LERKCAFGEKDSNVMGEGFEGGRKGRKSDALPTCRRSGQGRESQLKKYSANVNRATFRGDYHQNVGRERETLQS